jgi:hypothetical protein
MYQVICYDPDSEAMGRTNNLPITLVGDEEATDNIKLANYYADVMGKRYPECIYTVVCVK